MVGKFDKRFILRPFYSPWMAGVLILFVVCEGLFFYWGHVPGDHTDATHYAELGLCWAFLFLVMRVLQVRGIPVLKTLLFLGVLTWIVIYPRSFVDFWVRENGENRHCTLQLARLGKHLAATSENGRKYTPRAFFVDSKTGQPKFGWRMRYLMDERWGGLCEAGYDYRKPWDDPQNLAATSKMFVEEFQCPYISRLPGQLEERTDYVAVMGDDTLWPTNRSFRRFKDVTAGLENTAMLIEIKDSDIPWYEPRDVCLEDFLSGKLSWTGTAPHPYRRHLGIHSLLRVFEESERGRHILMANGSVLYTQGEMTPDQIRRLFSITEPFDIEKELPRCSSLRPIPFRYAVFYIWLGTLFMQLAYAYFPVRKKRQELQQIKEEPEVGQDSNEMVS